MKCHCHLCYAAGLTIFPSLAFFLDFIFILFHCKWNFDFRFITYITDFMYSDNSHVSVTKHIFPSEESRGQVLFLGAPCAALLEGGASCSPGPFRPELSPRSLLWPRAGSLGASAAATLLLKI